MYEPGEIVAFAGPLNSHSCYLNKVWPSGTIGREAKPRSAVVCISSLPLRKRPVALPQELGTGEAVLRTGKADVTRESAPVLERRKNSRCGSPSQRPVGWLAQAGRSQEQRTAEPM